MSERTKGATNNSLLFRLLSSTDGTPKTGLDVTTLKLQYERPGEAVSTATSLTLLAALTTAFTAYGAKECDSTNSPGVYRVDAPDGAFATGNSEVAITIAGTGILSATRLVDLLDVDMRRSGGTVPLAAGGINMQTLSNPLLEMLSRRVLFTGVTTTLVTADLYLPYDQVYNNASTYKSTTLGTPVYLWSNGTNYIASTVIGTNGAAYFQSSTNAVNGTWTAQGTAGGTTTVVAHGHAQLAAIQFDQTLPSAAQVGTIPTSGTINTTTPPTVIAIRSEMDSNSTKLANLDATVSSRLATSGYTSPPSSATIASAVMTTQLTESYAADGVAPTPAQSLMAIQQLLTELVQSGSTILVKKLDGTTTAMTLTATVDGSNNVTALTRSA